MKLRHQIAHLDGFSRRGVIFFLTSGWKAPHRELVAIEGQEEPQAVQEEHLDGAVQQRHRQQLPCRNATVPVRKCQADAGRTGQVSLGRCRCEPQGGQMPAATPPAAFLQCRHNESLSKKLVADHVSQSLKGCRRSELQGKRAQA